MLHGEAFPLLAGTIVLGLVHGIEPGHGWPVAASYALDQSNEWLYGFAASSLIGIGHLISSLAMVGAFFYAKSYFQLTQVNRPVSILDGLTIGGPVSIVAGVLLIGLGIREYTHGHSHSHDRDHGHSHDHDHSEHTEGQSAQNDHVVSLAEERSPDGLYDRVKTRLSGIGRDFPEHGTEPATGTDRGLFGIAWFAFVLGFAHEEEFEIIGLCAGSTYCLELMTAYALTVVVGIVGLTMLLIAGYQECEETVEKYTPYLPLFSATVLIVMGLGFIAGLF